MVVVAATFEALVLHAAMPVLLYVHAPWCEACAVTAVEVDTLATMWQVPRLMAAWQYSGRHRLALSEPH